MRVKTPNDDLTGYFVTITRENPRSEEHLPLSDIMSGAALVDQPAQEPPDVSAAVAAAVAPLLQRIAALEVVPVAATVIANPDMPRFMRDMSPAAGTQPLAGPSVDDAIAAVNDIESRVMSAFDQLARRVDEIANRLDMAPVVIDPQDHSESVATIEDYLRAMDDRISRADEMARKVAAEQAARAAVVEPMEPPVEPVPPPVEPMVAATKRIRDAAKAKRDAAIGETADARDTSQRFTEIALNSRSGRDEAIELMERIAAPYGIKWDDLALDFVTVHDRANRLVVLTSVIESAAVAKLSTARTEDLDTIVEAALAAIEKTGGV